MPAAAEPIGVATTVDGPDDDGGITIKVPIDCVGAQDKTSRDGKTSLADHWGIINDT